MGIVGMVRSLLVVVGAASKDPRPGALCQSPALSFECMFSTLEAKNCASSLGSFDLVFRDEREARSVDTVEGGDDFSETREKVGRPGSFNVAR